MLTTVRTLFATLAVVATLAACTANAAAPSGVATLESANPAADASAEPSASLDPEAAALAFAECMREHGIDMPDPHVDGSRVMVRGNASSDASEGAEGPQTRSDFFGADPSSPEFQEAEEACRPILGEFGPNGGPQFQTAPEPAKP